MFKKGDFVKLKPNTELDSGQIVNDWAGTIEEIHLEDECCLITLDSKTINSFDIMYILNAIEMEEAPFQQIIDFENLEISMKRDNQKEMKRALKNLGNKVLSIHEEINKTLEDHFDSIPIEFKESKHYAKLTNHQKEIAEFIIETFMDFMFTHQNVQFEEWNIVNIRYVCLELVPAKISSEIEIFENYGDVLISYLKYLGENEYILNQNKLIKEVQNIKNEIVVAAKNPNNWGNAKSIAMSAIKNGIDINDKASLESLLDSENLNNLTKVEEHLKNIKPLHKELTQGIGRNQKISVKYNDGRIIEEIKFKKVESDIRKGLCVLIKKLN